MQLAPELGGHVIEGLGSTDRAPALPGAPQIAQQKGVAPQQHKRPPPRAHQQYNAYDKPTVECELCVELGRKISLNHKYSECWMNPNSHNFRPAVYRARLAQLAD